MSEAAFKAGYVAIVGEPNVGKSTLMNALLSQNISIVTNKPQTTRQRVLGILTTESGQIIFLDTPGLVPPRYLLHEKMMHIASRAFHDADVIVVMTDVARGTELPEAVETMVLQPHAAKPLLLVINKVDTVDRNKVLPLIDAFSRRGVFREIVPVSALKQENVRALETTLIHYLPEHPPLYPPDIVSKQPERFFVAEFIREKIFEQFHDEIPYATAVEIREFKEREEGKTYISADIVVERDSQKGILIGKKGKALKRIGQQAREDIELFLGRRVFLELFVKVGEGWRRNERWLRRLGYEES
jgi:GTP-binding protein Era